MHERRCNRTCYAAHVFHTGTQEVGLTGVIGFYAGMSRDFGGRGTLLDRAAGLKYPVLALFGGADAGIPADQVEALDVELDKAGVEHEIITYPGAPHSFFDRRTTDFADACADAWTRVLSFIVAHSGRDERQSCHQTRSVRAVP